MPATDPPHPWAAAMHHHMRDHHGHTAAPPASALESAMLSGLHDDQHASADLGHYHHDD